MSVKQQIGRFYGQIAQFYQGSYYRESSYIKKVRPAGEIAQTRNMMKYGFACGKLSVLATRALEPAVLDRLLSTSTVEQRVRVMADTSYSAYFEGVTSELGLEDGLERALKHAYEFLTESHMESSFELFFRMRIDYENVKAIIKARTMGVRPQSYVAEGGMVPVQDLLDLADSIPTAIRQLFEQLNPDEMQSSVYPTYADVDDWVDQAYFQQRIVVASKTKSIYLVNLARLDIDLANAKILLRSLRAHVSSEALEKKVLGSGSRSVVELVSLYQTIANLDADVPSKANALASKLISIYGLKGLAAEQLVDAKVLDVALRAVYNRALNAGAHLPAGPEPIIAYIGRIEAEISLLRIVLVGLANDVSADTLRIFVSLSQQGRD